MKTKSVTTPTLTNQIWIPDLPYSCRQATTVYIFLRTSFTIIPLLEKQRWLGLVLVTISDNNLSQVLLRPRLYYRIYNKAAPQMVPGL